MPSIIESGNENNKSDFKVDVAINQDGIFLPINIFSNGASCLESISMYLKGSIGLRYCEIAGLLNRDDRTIWGACRGAKEKSDEDFLAEESSINVPLAIFEDRSLSVLEALAEYLKEDLNLRYCKIAALLNKDPRTIWTVYRRAKKKRKENAKAN